MKLIHYYHKSNKKIAVWGYGLKGTSFLNLIKPVANKISYFIDMNKSMQGTHTISGQEIIPYERIEELEIDVIIVMNKAHFADNHNLVRDLNLERKIKLIDLDEIVENQISCQAYLKNDYRLKKDFSTDVDMKEIQNQVYIILQEVDRICRKNRIPYFLSAGTALGAIRHKGFVPWDNDIDIGMLRKDYNNFQKIVKRELGSEFYYQTLQPNRDFYYPFDQVVKNHTSYVQLEHKDAKFHHGFHIDIFPFDKVSSNPKSREKQVEDLNKYRYLMKAKKLKYPYKSKNPLHLFLINYEYYMLKLVPYRYLKKKIDETLTKYNKTNTEYIADLCTHYKKVMYFKRSEIFPIKKVSFESGVFPVPRETDTYLTMMYGDYMTPPPENKRTQKYRIVDVSYKRNYYLDDTWL